MPKIYGLLPKILSAKNFVRRKIFSPEIVSISPKTDFSAEKNWRNFEQVPKILST